MERRGPQIVGDTRVKVGLHRALAVVAIAASTWAAGCHPSDRGQASGTEQTTTTPKLERYRLTGKVVSVDVNGRRAVIDHQAIPQFMAAMTMSYPVRDRRALERLVPGEKITADVVVTADSLWLEHIAIVGPKP